MIKGKQWGKVTNYWFIIQLLNTFPFFSSFLINDSSLITYSWHSCICVSFDRIELCISNTVNQISGINKMTGRCDSYSGLMSLMVFLLLQNLQFPSHFYSPCFLHIFLLSQVKKICVILKTTHLWWSFPIFSYPTYHSNHLLCELGIL